MNINELHSLKLSDYLKFHDELNPVLWDQDQNLRPQVRQALLTIADDFSEFLGIDDIGLKDITISGSNAAYNYTDTSDIDLHLVVDLPEADSSEIYRELFDAKKYQYNDQHNITIGGYDVELYVQNANKPHYSTGIYSVLNDQWLSIPKKIKTNINDDSVKSKFEDLENRIQTALESNNLEKIKNLFNKIKNMRSAGLAEHGEFGVENLVFKLLRAAGLIGQLKNKKDQLRDRELSLLERKRKKQKKPKIKYGFGGFWYPGYSFSNADDSGESGPGENKINENIDSTDLILTFADQIAHDLGIINKPKLIIHRDTDWTKNTGSFGRYDPDDNILHIATSNRHILDIIRTLSHELVHCAQKHRGDLPPDAGKTGSRHEDEANALAGRIMRHLADERPELFKKVTLESSGYIPTEAEKNDSRFLTALTKDVRPGETGRQANRLRLQTGPNGEPDLLMKEKSNLREWSASELDELGNQRPSGPEKKPTMPKGTVKVDVSDVYDWYKLGQHISNMKGLGRHDFGRG
jgi:hypothetical protein